MNESQNKEETKASNKNFPKRVWKWFVEDWKESGLGQLLDINTKLSRFDKTLNILWACGFIISIVVTSQLFNLGYLSRTLPILIFGFISLLILFRKSFGGQRFLQFSITVGMMALFHQWIDFHSYLKNDYKIVEGIPSKFVYHEHSKSRDEWEVVVDDVTFTFPDILKKQYSDQWFVIRFLPRSKYILDYQVLPKDE